jgi:hypothetical protein
MIFPPFFNPGSFSGETEVKVVIHLSQRLGSYLGYKVQSAYLNLQFAKNANCFSRLVRFLSCDVKKIHIAFLVHSTIAKVLFLL